MREIVIISGKGGTGKTSICAAFAHLAQNKIICDLDVDAPDLHILLDPAIRELTPFISGYKAAIRPADCVDCGRCAELCAFGAIARRDDAWQVDPLRCEGCRVCASLCPQQAIDAKPSHCGDWYVSDTRFGPLVHAQLFPGEENSGRLVSQLKAVAREQAKKQGLETILCDGSPGTGCPVIASLSGAHLAVGVVEPTPSGRHDFTRIADLCRHFRIPLGVIINKADLNRQEAEAIAAQCQEDGLRLLGRLPFDPEVTRAMIRGQALTESDNSIGNSLREIWSALQDWHPVRLQ
ncbi:MAG: ATP-binding protein [Desulfovibrionaceae bacterium]|nr:ATP-binding protein [Desulfovibrionaceae bacterium]